MPSISKRAVWSATSLATIAIAAGMIAACGDDDGEPSEPTAVTIEATGAEGSLSYDAPSAAPAGAAVIEFTNSSELDQLDAQIAYTVEEHSDQEVIAELRNAFEGEPVADWFQGGGGVAATPQGETGSVTQELRAGTYYVVGGEDVPKTPLAKIEVSGEDGAELPDADATVTAREYSFSGEGLTAGSSTLLLENAGAQWHHFLAAPLKEGATIEEAQRYLESEGEDGGPPPFEEGEESANQVESTVLEGGSSQLVEVDLEAGRYAFFCFVADKEGGTPHVVKGMVSEITIEE